jgi:hypothetical protein
MAVATDQPESHEETTYQTKRVFMRAEQNDRIETTEVVDNFQGKPVPETFTVVQRVMTYFGPRLRVEADTDAKQYLLTAPSPETQALFWRQIQSDWAKAAEVCLDFSDSLPQYDICLHCNEPLSTVEHRRRAAIGVCETG